ncbi:hypothetical protein C1646_751802 [Rhizophagus diaphanus]|nr:hypothetical protein C1646_751802 [Rhizophagus diaphanus] [Rhizophagus sp. MUCL 43196]
MISEYYEIKDKRAIHNTFYKILKSIANDQKFTDEARNTAKELIEKRIVNSYFESQERIKSRDEAIALLEKQLLDNDCEIGRLKDQLTEYCCEINRLKNEIARRDDEIREFIKKDIPEAYEKKTNFPLYDR